MSVDLFQGTVAELLMLSACRTCRREDRLTVQSHARYLYIACDCGTVGASSGKNDIIAAVNNWNFYAVWNAQGDLISTDGTRIRLYIEEP